jgi:hypothetical protein
MEDKLMSKIRLSAAALALAAAPALAQLATPLPSPNATVAQTIGITKAEVVYSRPSVKGRVIWGELVPYDKVWRTGANALTRISFDTDVTVEGQKLAAGTYGLFTIPGKTEWTVIFSKQSTGSPFDYAADKDALRVKVKPAVLAESKELFTISFPAVSANGATLQLAWEKLKVSLAIGVDTNAAFLHRAKEAVADAKVDDWRTSLTAARGLYDMKYAPEDASKFLERSLSTKETFGNLALKARVLAGQGDRKGAVLWGEKALAAAKTADPKPDVEAVAELEKSVAGWKK